VKIPNIVLGLLFSISFSSAQSTDFLGFDASFINSNPDYQKALLDFELSEIAYLPTKYGWFPQAYVSLSPSLNVLDDDPKMFTETVGTTFGFTQKLPLGHQLDAAVSQAITMRQNGIMVSSYTPSSSVTLLMPLLSAAPTLLESIIEWEQKEKDIALKIAQLNLFLAKKECLVSGVSAIGAFLINRRSVGIALEKNSILLQQAEDDSLLWAQGRLSTLEISTRDQERNKSYTDMLQKQKALLVSEQTLVSLGINSGLLPQDPNDFLNFWRNSIDEYVIFSQNKKRLEKYILIKSWKEMLAQETSSLPLVTCSFSLFPVSDTDEVLLPNESIEEFWTSNINWNWNLSISMKIALVPWDASYTADALHETRVKIQKIKQYQLEIATDQENQLRIKILQLYQDALVQAEKSYSVALERYELAKELLLSGRLSDLDLQLQRIMLEEADCALLQSRLGYITAALGFY
jgi:hypothetical protein